MSGSIKIIGGRFKGKKIPVLSQSLLRPTPNRVRETLFNWLMHDIRQSTCLDVFAGSGALGLEAFSRGAQQVMFVEKDVNTYRQLQKTLASFKATELKLCQMDALTYLKTTSAQFDVIFLDPPFQSTLLSECLEILQVTHTLKPNGIVYIETNELPLMLEEYWTCLRRQQAGLVHYGLYQRTSG